MDLPVHPVSLASQNPVHILGRLLRCGVGANVAGVQAVANGQHIHTNRGSAGLVHGKGDFLACPGENT